MVFRLCLAAFFGFLLVSQIWLVLTMGLSWYFLLFALFPLAVIATLFEVGGQLVRMVALVFCGLLMLCGMLFVAMMISLFFKQEYDNVSPIVLATLGAAGGVTWVFITRLNTTTNT